MTVSVLIPPANVVYLSGITSFDGMPVQAFREHEWNATRFGVLGRIRNASFERDTPSTWAASASAS